MILNFRQGLVSFQLSGSQPRFLMPSSTPGYIDLSISPTPFIATIAHGGSNYLLKFDETVQAAFGPLIAGVDNYLFIELNLLTGAVSQGVSQYETIVSPTEPASSAAGMMWYDMTANVMKVRNTNNTKYIETPRVVVGKVLNGNTAQIVPGVVGTTVGANTPCAAGFILLDSLQRPVRTSSGELMTTDSVVSVKTTVGTSGVLSQPLNAFIPVRAAEPIPQMSLVYFSSADSVSLASSDPSLLNLKTPIGVVQSALALNELGVITQNGEITWDQWDFAPATFGKPLYCGWNGEITSTRPQNYHVYRIGFVKNSNTILMNIDSETQAQVVSQAGTLVIGAPPIIANTATNLAGELISTISIQPATALQPGFMSASQAADVASFDARITTTEAAVVTLTSTKAGIIHGHAQSDVIGLTTVLNDLQIAVSGKIDKVSPSTATHFAALTATGTLVDGGVGAVDFAAATHTHVIADTTNLQTELNNRALVNHTHSIAQVSSLQAVLDSKAAAVHTHIIADTTGLQSALDGKSALGHGHIVSDVAGLQGLLDGKAPMVHGHAIGEVSGLQTALNGKAATVHTHIVSDVTGLQGLLDGKAPTVHGHAISDVDLLQDALDAKAALGHGHVVSDITGLQSELDGKAPLAHTHALSAGSITDVDTTSTAPTTGQVLSWNGAVWVPGSIPTPPPLPEVRYDDSVNGTLASVPNATDAGALTVIVFGAGLSASTTYNAGTNTQTISIVNTGVPASLPALTVILD